MSMMKQHNTMIKVAAASLLMASATASANLSTTVSVVSDYSFNGVSQTDSKPALQASLDYAADSGWYVGSWASNVDFGGGDDTRLEWDFYAGQYLELTDSLSLDTGIAYYTYGGASASSDYNYPELYAKFGYSSALGASEVNFWYTWDYFGLGGKHYIAMLAHNIEIAEGHNIRISADRSTSGDEKAWAWDGGKSFNHFRLAYQTSWQGFNVELAAEDTSMDYDAADGRVVLSLSRSFSL